MKAVPGFYSPSDKFKAFLVALILLFPGNSGNAQDKVTEAASATGTDVFSFARVVPGKDFHFPEDHGLHPDFQSEWWYVTANLSDSEGNQFGIQYTLFAAADIQNNNKMRIYFAHATLTTEQAFFFAERYAREDMEHAGVQSSPWMAYLDHWRFEGAEDAPFPGRLQVTEETFGYDLTTSDSPYFLQGDHGYSQKNDTGTMASYYYSAPFVKVKGVVTVAGKAHQVEGEAWLDREWSTSVVRAENLGWDWFALHLDDSTALMLYRLRSQGEQYFYGNLMQKEGGMIPLAKSDFTFIAGKSAEFNQQEYTLEWQILIPSLNIDIVTRPVNEGAFLRTRIPYWEGPVRISGSHEAVGFMELFGARTIN